MKKLLILLVFVLLLACGVPPILQPVAPTAPIQISTQTPMPVSEAMEPTIPSTATNEPRSEAILLLPYNENVMVNLATSACKARWSNNLTSLPCPGEPSATDGAVISLEQSAFPNGMIIRNQTMLTIPGYGSNGGGIFGRYPAYTVESDKTHFMTGLTCLSLPCHVDFGLGYYDQAGIYRDLITWTVDSSRFTEEYGFWEEVDYDLSSFAGKTIELVLVVRNAPNQRVEALWIEPMIYLKY